MTLNLVLASPDAVHVGADFRLVDGNTGKLITDASPKVLVIREDDWEAVLTYCGVGRWQKRDTSDWAKGWLQHDPATTPSFDQAASILEREGNKWLARMRTHYVGAHSFVLSGLVRGSSRIALISNYDRLHSRPKVVAITLTTDYLSATGRVFVFGSGADAVVRSARRSLAASLKRGDDASQLHRQIGGIIEKAAQAPQARQTISKSSFSYSLLPYGKGQGHLQGTVQGPLQVSMLTNGQDLFSNAGTLQGPKVVHILTAHASIRADNPVPVERCDMEKDDSNSFEFRIIELADLGSGHARAKSINASGLVVGESSHSPHGAQRACYWSEDVNPNEIAVGKLSSWAVDVNDGGAIAGTLHTPEGSTRAFVICASVVQVSGTLGGFHANAHAINNLGEVVGGSWSIPGNTPGDKRDRAFTWTPGGEMRDLGALGDDWCSRAYDINDHGVIIGRSHPRTLFGGPYLGVIWIPSKGMRDLGSLDGRGAAPIAINNRNEVVGLASLNGRSVSFLWTEGSGMHLLPLPDESSVRTIGNKGQIVYTMQTALGARAHVRIDDRDVALPCYRGHQSEASHINDRGDIVGHIWRGNHGHAVKWSRN